MKYTIKFTEPVNGKTEVLTDNYQITNLRLQFGKDLKESTPIRNVISVKQTRETEYPVELKINTKTNFDMICVILGIFCIISAVTLAVIYIFR